MSSSRQITTWLLCLASTEVDDAISLHREVLRRTFPGRSASMRQFLVGDGPSSDVDRRGLALIDPTSRRRGWLIATRSDGRRTPAPYLDDRDAARRFASRDGT
jgi:hypothetical protein